MVDISKYVHDVTVTWSEPVPAESMAARKRRVRETIGNSVDAMMFVNPVRPWVVVTLGVPVDGKMLWALGIACCGKSDPWDFAMGRNIALGRAVADIARQMGRGH